MARTPQRTLTGTMRSSEHVAHRLLMHMCSHIALVAQGLALCVIHTIHACAPVFGLLSVLFLVSLSFYFFLQFLFQVYLMSIPAPDEMSMEDPLCDSSLGGMVTLDYVTPLTLTKPTRKRLNSTVAIGGSTRMWHTSIQYPQGTNLNSKMRCQQCNA